MDYYAEKDSNGKIIDGGTFRNERDAIAWYNRNRSGGSLYKKVNHSFYLVDTDTEWVERMNAKS